jgi:hypothetical protein
MTDKAQTAPLYQKPNEDKDSIPDARGDQTRAREMEAFIGAIKGDDRFIILWRPEENLFKKTEANGRVSFRRPQKGDYQVPDDCILSNGQIIPECRPGTQARNAGPERRPGTQDGYGDERVGRAFHPPPAKVLESELKIRKKTG